MKRTFFYFSRGERRSALFILFLVAATIGGRLTERHRTDTGRPDISCDSVRSQPQLRVPSEKSRPEPPRSRPASRKPKATVPSGRNPLHERVPRIGEE